MHLLALVWAEHTECVAIDFSNHFHQVSHYTALRSICYAWFTVATVKENIA